MQISRHCTIMQWRYSRAIFCQPNATNILRTRCEERACVCTRNCRDKISKIIMTNAFQNEFAKEFYRLKTFRHKLGDGKSFDILLVIKKIHTGHMSWDWIATTLPHNRASRWFMRDCETSKVVRTNIDIISWTEFSISRNTAWWLAFPFFASRLRFINTCMFRSSNRYERYKE